MRRAWLREPLFHFVLVGSLLFGVYGALDLDADERRGVVRITAADVEWLKASWTRQHQRPPDDRELRRLVSDTVREQLLAREARTLGLDEDDTVVRRRLAQKMEFLLQDAVLLADPDEAELRRLYDRDRSRYRNAARISFTQVFFSSEIDAERGLVALEAGPADEFGEPTLLAREYGSTDEKTVADLFGREFAEDLFGLEVGAWRGPFRSAYGFHLVRVTERQAATALPFDEARERIQADWLREREADAEDLLLRSLLEKYELIVEEGVQPWLGPLASADR
ncbi:MAG: peptidylprolyl isomerase [Myxococcota bacterium]|nr:peptidylprolyl isomerase [Myxococcota bacterium]